MGFLSKRIIKSLFKEHGIYPSKRLGQNFLIDKGVLGKIMAAADLKVGDIILEIGPGTGILTQELAKKAGKVIAIEKDYKMVEILKETAKNLRNVKISQGDILTVGNWGLGIGDSYRVVANLPYYIVSPVIRKFLESENPPKEMILMVQKEVAQRICSKPPHMSLLAASVQFYAKPEIISFVSKSSFWPQPKVDSAILKISNIKSAFNQRRKSAFNQRFFRIVKAGFAQPRKQIVNNLSKGLKIDKEKIKNWLLKNKIQPQRRAETLSIQEWLRLTKTFPSISY
jgi:16S rRNA (adenine1518-N6/adenine1519-N6)-dimethyltransferase